MNCSLLRFVIVALLLLAIPLLANAQVHGSGPSDPALFDTVINLPPDPDIGFNESIGGATGQTIQLNVMAGGSVGDSFDANPGSEMNISGGSVGWGLFASRGSCVNISGGSVCDGFKAFLGSDVELFGGEFTLNGTPYANSTITLNNGDLFTGTLTDGSAYIFSSEGDDLLIGVTLTPTELPAVDTTPIVVNTELPARPSGLRAGQTLTLQDGGRLGASFEAVDATLNIEGGTLGEFAGVVRSAVNISGGSVGCCFDALSGSEVNISGGTVRDSFEAFSASEVNISGGAVGDDFRANSGSVVNLLGSEFFLDDVLMENLVPGEAFTITERNVLLAGLLTDGTPFDFELNGTFTFGEDLFDPESTLTITLIVPGDFDVDGDVDGGDVDFYIGSLGQPATGELAKLDLDNDGVVTLADHNLHVSTLVTTSNGVTGAFLGDINLDGSVDVLDDAFALVASLGQSVTSRAQGDLNADGLVNVLRDAFLLVADLGKSTD